MSKYRVEITYTYEVEAKGSKKAEQLAINLLDCRGVGNPTTTVTKLDNKEKNND